MSKQWLSDSEISVNWHKNQNETKNWWWCIAWKSPNHIDCHTLTHTHHHLPFELASRMWVVLWKLFFYRVLSTWTSPNGIFTFSHALQWMAFLSSNALLTITWNIYAQNEVNLHTLWNKCGWTTGVSPISIFFSFIPISLIRFFVYLSCSLFNLFQPSFPSLNHISNIFVGKNSWICMYNSQNWWIFVLCILSAQYKIRCPHSMPNKRARDREINREGKETKRVIEKEKEKETLTTTTNNKNKQEQKKKRMNGNVEAKQKVEQTNTF